MKTEPSTEGKVDETSGAVPTQRAAYQPPRLRRLGSVREITQGSSVLGPDTNGGQKATIT